MHVIKQLEEERGKNEELSFIRESNYEELLGLEKDLRNIRAENEELQKVI